MIFIFEFKVFLKVGSGSKPLFQKGRIKICNLSTAKSVSRSVILPKRSDQNTIFIQTCHIQICNLSKRFDPDFSEGSDPDQQIFPKKRIAPDSQQTKIIPQASPAEIVLQSSCSHQNLVIIFFGVANNFSDNDLKSADRTFIGK